MSTKNIDSTATVVIIHPVFITKEFLLGAEPGFPPGDRFLNPAVIHQAVAALVARYVAKFDDGFFHGEAHPFGMADLFSSLSAHDAYEQDFHTLDTKPGSGKKIVVHAGIRWEVSSLYKQVRLYGPYSDPNNVLKIDLTQKAGS